MCDGKKNVKNIFLIFLFILQFVFTNLILSIGNIPKIICLFMIKMTIYNLHISCYFNIWMAFIIKLYQIYFIFFMMSASCICKERYSQKTGSFCTITRYWEVICIKIGFIGAGKVGFSLGKYLLIHGHVVSGYYSRSCNSAKEAAAFTQTKFYENLASIVEDSDTLFVTVPDDVIGNIWDDMRNLPIKNKNICHCSGLISSNAFFNAQKYGAYVYSVHPLYAISDKYHSYQELSKAYFAIEGSEKNLHMMQQLFQSMGNRVILLSSAQKNLYHAAAVMVSNQMLAMADVGIGLLMQCGFEREDAKTALYPLMMGNLQKLADMDTTEILTGPVERNDVVTVQKHMAALPKAEKDIYKILSQKLVAIAKRKHPQRDYTNMEREIGR